MRIGFVELVLLLFIASITVGPNAALFVDQWLPNTDSKSFKTTTSFLRV